MKAFKRLIARLAREGSQLDEAKMIVDALIRQVVQDNLEYQQRLREFYRKDYKLYDSVPFYRAG